MSFCLQSSLEARTPQRRGTFSARNNNNEAIDRSVMILLSPLDSRQYDRRRSCMFIASARRFLLYLVFVCMLPRESFGFVSAAPPILRPIRQRADSFGLTRKRKLRGVLRSSKPNDDEEGAAVEEEETENYRAIRKNLNRDFCTIAGPAFLQQVAVPFADLVDSTFLSKLNPEALGGVGVARASQAAVSKLYTSALSKTTISFIASKYGASRSDESEESRGVWLYMLFILFGTVSYSLSFCRRALFGSYDRSVACRNRRVYADVSVFIVCWTHSNWYGDITDQ